MQPTGLNVLAKLTTCSKNKKELIVTTNCESNDKINEKKMQNDRVQTPSPVDWASLSLAANAFILSFRNLSESLSNDTNCFDFSLMQAPQSLPSS